MTVSGIVVACLPEHLDDVSGAVSALPWAEVHHCDPRGRLVVTLEASNVGQSMDRLIEIQSLQRVLSAELAEYYLEEDA